MNAAAAGVASRVRIDFDNSYARLPPQFFARQDPVPVAAPELIVFNTALADELRLHTANADAATLAQIFAGNRVLEGSEPIAQAYAGHQFGGFVPQLGDGRALLLGEVIDQHGARRDIQLKGSGRTPFSRGGDGRAAIGPVLREYLVSEAMHALGIPATRALAAVTTGETVIREGRVPGGIVTRVAASHVRVGTFQYFAARGDRESVRRLADLVIDRHYPDLRGSVDPYLGLLRAVAGRQSSLIARWMGVGFIHGVMNTDNMTVSGETIDFGPCAFMDGYHPDTVFSSIDRTGRYAYSNQAPAAQWNLARFAETLLPLIDDDPPRAAARASEVVSAFAHSFEADWLAVMRAKLGFATAADGDADLLQALLDAMQRREADFTQTWRRLCHLADEPAPAVEAPPSARPAGPPQPAPSTAESSSPALAAGDDWFTAAPEGIAWTHGWRGRCARENISPAARGGAMRRANPALIPRNHRIEQVIAAAVGGDFSPFHALSVALAAPHAEPGAHAAAYLQAPQSHERVLQTFCGT